MKDRLSRYGSVALVTGASSGIGAVFCKKLAALGFTVIAVARRGERLEQLRLEVEGYGKGAVVPIILDLQDREAADTLFATVTGQGLQVDLLINNAGFGTLGSLDSAPREKALGMIDLNCRAVVDLTCKFLPGMKERRRGGIIIISSVVGAIPTPWFAVYSATKAFDLYFGEALYAECQGSGVDVLTVLPGLTSTEFQAGSGMRDYHSAYRSPEQVVESALTAIGRKAIVVDGALNKLLVHGTRFVPRALLLALSRVVMRKELRL